MKPLEVIDVQVRCSCRCFGVCNHRIKNASPSEPSYRRVTPLQGTGVLHLYKVPACYTSTSQSTLSCMMGLSRLRMG